MNRATKVYILVVGFCAVGLWAIVRAGRHLHAPPDISGAWLIEPAEVAATGPPGADLPGERMWVEQSGLFFQLRFARPGGGGRVLDLKAAEWPAPGAAGATRYLLTGDGWEVSARLSDQRRSMRVRIAGPEPALFVARRSAEDFEVAPAPQPHPLEPPPPETHHAAPETRPAAPGTQPTSETEPASRPSTSPAS